MTMPGEHDRMSASDVRKRNANLMETSLRGRDRLALGFRETTDLAPAFLRTPQVSVERVVEESSAGHDIWIIAPDLGEPLADRPQAGGFRLGARLVGKIGAMDDPREALERGVLWELIRSELLERTAAVPLLVRVLRARCV